jgi:hypothetical protein
VGTVDPIYRKFAARFAVFFALFEIVYLATSKLPYDAVHHIVGWDYLNTWMGAHAALFGRPQDFFDFEHYNAILRGVFPGEKYAHNWSYPPHILLLIWPFGLFPYLVSYALWTVGGLAAFLWVGCEGKLDRGRLLFLAAAPVVLINVLTGQNGLFTGAILVCALTNWDRRPALAGILFGVLSVKPQLILLVPLVLILTRRWRCLGFAALTCAAMFAATTLLFGISIWDDYLAEVAPFQRHILEYGGGITLAMMPTAFVNARLMGSPLELAWALQVVVSIVAIAVVAWTFWRPRDPLLSIAVLLIGSLLVTPYAFNYDMAALTIVLTWLRERADNETTDRRFTIALWALPVVMMLGFIPRIAGSVFVLLAFGARLIQRLSAQSSEVSSASAGISAATVSMTLTS